ncbi:histidine phosphatase family protein [Cohnella cellulosilytica]|uniref:Histidine phosphatase family protein n=1 Tax=Cohnella cellulosilytica TaxID=986710 RepID=A0ABW2FL68_9BACL
MKHIILIRHCKAGGQEPTAPLTDEGRLQAEQLAEFLTGRRIDYMVSSPFDRAIATIRPLAQRRSLEIHIEDRLCERGLSSEQLPDWMEKLSESFVDLDLKFPGGESSREAMNRGISVIKELIERQERNIAVVTHGNLLSLILKHYNDRFGFNEWRSLTNPDVYELALSDKEMTPSIKRIWK